MTPGGLPAPPEELLISPESGGGDVEVAGGGAGVGKGEESGGSEVAGEAGEAGAGRGVKRGGSVRMSVI